MGMQEKAKKATAAGVAIATTGLSGCGESIVVDPLPPPLTCSSVNEGQTLVATAERVDRALSVMIRHNPSNDDQLATHWRSAEVTDLTGVSVVNVVKAPDGESTALLVTFLLDSDITSSGSFTLSGVMVGTQGNECNVTRTFSITVDGQEVIVAQLQGNSHDLPLVTREPAQVVVAQQDGRELELLAHTRYTGEYEARWSVTGGELGNQVGERTSWRLPAEAGLYQVRLVVDYGREGLAVDAMTWEVRMTNEE
jgi:hypothetical protein